MIVFELVFEFMASAPLSLLLLSSQDTNWFLVYKRFEPRSLTQRQETLPIELTGTHASFLLITTNDHIDDEMVLHGSKLTPLILMFVPKGPKSSKK